MKSTSADLITVKSHCQELIDLVPAYCIGVTDEDETHRIEQGLNECPELEAAIARYRDLDSLVADAVPPLDPPPEILGHLLSAAKASPRRPRNRSARRTFLRWAAIAACLAIVFLANNLYWANRLNQEGLRELHLATAANGRTTGAYGCVIYSLTSDEAILTVSDFPPLTADASYQAWVRRGETITSLGVFRVDDSGSGSLTFAADRLDQPFDTVGVTREPLGGSPAPTSPPVARWTSS